MGTRIQTLGRRALALGFIGRGTAAKQLVEAGYSVTLLEGRSRIGGRLYTNTTAVGAPVDLGASWIHVSMAEQFIV